MQALAERTGSHTVTFMTRGHVDDSVVPGWYATTGASHFFMDVLNLNPWDVVRLFEQWACARSSSQSCTPLLLHSLIYDDGGQILNSAKQCLQSVGTL